MQNRTERNIPNPPIPPSMTPEEAIFQVWQKTTRLETVILGVLDTQDKGLCGDVEQNREDLDATRKKVGKLEIRIWILIAFLVGSGVVSGAAAVQLINAP